MAAWLCTGDVIFMGRLGVLKVPGSSLGDRLATGSRKCGATRAPDAPLTSAHSGPAVLPPESHLAVEEGGS